MTPPRPQPAVWPEPGEIGRVELPRLAAVPGLAHGFLTRAGGVSPAPVDSLNLSVSTGDAPANVAENLRRVADAFRLRGLVSVHQVHGRQVAAFEGSLAAGETHRVLGRADAVITNARGIGLLVKTADCLGLLLCDQAGGALGVVHAGWRGIVGGVVAAAVAAMRERFGCRAADLVAGLGPTLRPCCAEFVNHRTEFPAWMQAYRVGPAHFDLQAAVRGQLVEAGLSEGNIAAVELCTRCRGDLFFSYRGQRPATGRGGAVIGWPEES